MGAHVCISHCGLKWLQHKLVSNWQRNTETVAVQNGQQELDTLLVSSKHAYSFLEGNQAFSLNKVPMLYVTCMPVYNLSTILMVLEPRQQVFYK